MIECKMCKHPLETNSRFCTHCGASVTMAPQSATGSAKRSAFQQRRPIFWILLVTGIALGVITITVLVSFILPESPESVATKAIDAANNFDYATADQYLHSDLRKQLVEEAGGTQGFWDSYNQNGASTGMEISHMRDIAPTGEEELYDGTKIYRVSFFATRVVGSNGEVESYIKLKRACPIFLRGTLKYLFKTRRGSRIGTVLLAKEFGQWRIIGY